MDITDFRMVLFLQEVALGPDYQADIPEGFSKYKENDKSKKCTL